MFLSAALRSTDFRELLVSTWVSTTNRFEKLPSNFSISIFGKLLNIFYQRKNKRISKKKILIISLITNIAWTIFTINFTNESLKLPTYDASILIAIVIFALLLTTFPFYIFEYFQAAIILYSYSKLKNKDAFFIFISFLILTVLFYIVSCVIFVWIRDFMPKNTLTTFIFGFFPAIDISSHDAHDLVK